MRSLLLSAALAVLPAFAAPAAAQTPEGAAPIAGSVLRALPAAARTFTLSGERARLGFSVFLSDANARTGGELVLDLESAVSVMPEASSLVVLVGEREVGRVFLGGSHRAPRTIALPPADLRAGWNRITLFAEQRHRVDCSENGTFELWTRINNAASGLRFPEAGEPLPLPQVALDDTGALAIRVRADTRDPQVIAGALRAAAAIAKGAGATAARVDYDAGEGATAGRGVELVFGTRDELAGFGIDPAVAAAAGEAPQRLQPTGEAGALRIVMAHKVSADPEAVESLFASAPADALASENEPVDGSLVTLAALGAADGAFSGRVFREGVDLTLPADALIADYASVELRLNAAYAPGLSADSHLALFVNGALAATLPFGRTDGEVFTDHPIELPLSVFRPGTNRVEIEARVGRDADRSCTAQLQMTSDARFLFSGTSSLSVPKLARMARLPELAATLGSGRASPVEGAPMRLALGTFDRDTLSAAGTFFVRNALLADHVPNLAVGSAAMIDPNGTVVIGKAADIDETVARLAGLDPAALRALRERPQEEARAVVRDNSPDPILTGSIARESASVADRLAAWQNDFSSASGAGWAVGAANRAIEGVTSTFGLAQAEAPLPVDRRTGLVIAQAVPPNWTGPLTVVTAATAADLSAGTARLAQPDLWWQIHGRAVVMSGETLQSVPAVVAHLSATAEPSVGNLRLVVAAWLSLNPGLHAGLLLVSAVSLGGGLSLGLRRRRGQGGTR